MQYPPQAVYYNPYPVPMMQTPYGYASTMPPPQHGYQPHGVPPAGGRGNQFEARQRQHPAPRRAPYASGQSRERSAERRDGHHKPMREGPHGHTRPSSRSDTPTSQPQHRETPPVHHPPPASTGYVSQGMPASMTMHPHSAYYPVYPGYYPPAHGYSAPPGEGQMGDGGPGYQHKARLPLEIGSMPQPLHVPPHSMSIPENAEATTPKPTPTATTSKKRLQFFNPNTHTPIGKP